METITIAGNELAIEYVAVADIKPAPYNSRSWSAKAREDLTNSLKEFGFVDPVILNRAPGRENINIGGNFRVEIAKELGIEKVPAVYLCISDEAKEKELNLRLNKNTGEFDYDLLAENFEESFLANVGFESEELDSIFETESKEEPWSLEAELEKLSIQDITVQKGDVYDLDGSRLMCGDSTIEADMQKLMADAKADMIFTDPPYILDYLHGKTRHGEPTVGCGAKQNRRYLETESLPENFTQLWMINAHAVSAKHSSIIVYENWKNIRTISNEMEKHWKIRNMLVWHLPNRNQGYAGANKLFSKYDVAVVGTADEFADLNMEHQGELFENEYETALFAIKGKGAHWESYGKDKKYCPTDFIEFNAADEKSSGQAIVFGVKPIEILVPYIKVLTKRGHLVLEPFGGSGSTLIAATTLGRRCYLMEKVPTYAEVILNRWEKFTGKTRRKIA